MGREGSGKKICRKLDKTDNQIPVLYGTGE